MVGRQFQIFNRLKFVSRRGLLAVVGLLLIGNIFAGVKVLGSVWSSGEAAPGKTVFIKYDNKVDSVKTNSLGLFEANLSVNGSAGIITIQTINCINDTLSKFLNYTSRSDVFLISFENCNVKNHVLASCQVFYQDVPAPGVLMEFSINNFQNILGEAITGPDGKTNKSIMVGPNYSGKLSARIKDYKGDYVSTSNTFLAGDTVSMALFKCKAPNRTLLSGQAKRGDINLLKGEAKLLLYEYNPSDYQIYLVDSAITASGGGYTFFLKDSGYYLIKTCPQEAINGNYPGYANGSMFWDGDEVVFADNELHGVLTQNIQVNQQFMPYGRTTLFGKIRIEEGQKLSRSRPLIYLLDTNKNPISYANVQLNGTYKFQEVPIGNYLVWLDEPGRKTNPLKVEVKSNVDNIILMDIVVNAESIHPDLVSHIHINDSQITPHLYPNPFNDFLRIHKDGVLKVEIFSINGSKVMSKEISFEGELNTSELPDGVYTVIINSNNQITTQRLVKMK